MQASETAMSDEYTTAEPSAPAAAPRKLPAEPEIAVPGRPFVAACALTPLVGGALWAVGATGLGYSREIVATGVAGAAVVLVVSLATVMVVSPWKRRPASMQMTMWLAGTVMRFLATPALAFLLYSAAPLDGKALTLSVGVVHLATLITEATVMSRLLGRAAVPS